MRRLFLFLLFFSLCFGEEALKEFDRENNRIFELFADNVDSVDYKIVVAKGNAVMISQEVYILADYIKYNTQTREAEINGNVKFYKDGNLYFSTQKSNVKFDESYYIIEPFYMQDSTSGVWISASMAKSKDKEYEFKKIIVSACEVGDPIWRIEGTSGSYNQDSSLAGIWNPMVFIKDIPVFYFPYIFISTKNQRTTGFLYPEFGSSSLEGFIYIQPFFLALQDFWDITFSPQIRTLRGYGLNTQARFVDHYGKLFEFNFGIFNNFKKYKRKIRGKIDSKDDIENNIIYGFNFNHERRNILSEYFEDYDDGLYLDFRFMNDLDYIRLQDTKNRDIEDRIQTSKANFFGMRNDHYFGLYFKYFLDLQSPDNNDTFHTLPHLQYHKFLEQTEFKNLTYSVDLNAKNIVRYKGFGYFDNNVRIPLYFNLPLLDGYVNLGANVNANAGVITLNRTGELANLKGKNSTYFSTNFGLSLNSDIAKQYDKIFHSMSFKVDFSHKLYGNTEDNNKIFTPNEAIDEIKDSFGDNSLYSEMQPAVTFNFSQYFFGLDNVDLLYHRMSQTINIKDKNTQGKAQNLRNEIGFSPIPNIDISNTLYYSYQKKSIEEVSLSLSATFGYFKGLITYYFKKKFDNKLSCSRFNDRDCVDMTANFLRVRLSHDFSYFALYGDVGYDFNRGYLRDWNFIISKDIRCFGVGLKFANEITPILTSNGTKAIVNRYVSLEFRFVPLTATALSLRLK